MPENTIKLPGMALFGLVLIMTTPTEKIEAIDINLPPQFQQSSAIIDYIIRATGLFESDNLAEIDVQSADSKLENTIFMLEYIKGTTLVKYDCEKEFNSKNDSINRKRNFSILVDSVGNIVRIYSGQGKNTQSSQDYPAYIDIESQGIKPHLSNFKFIGYPDSAPSISFVKALDSINIDVQAPKEIVAYLVQYSNNNDISMPVWIIDYAGLPLTGRQNSLGIELGDNQQNYYREMINANTGISIIGMVYTLTSGANNIDP